MKALNGIVWPAIASLIGQQLNEAAASAEAPPRLPGINGLIGVVEAAVLLEAGWDAQVRPINERLMHVY